MPAEVMTKIKLNLKIASTMDAAHFPVRTLSSSAAPNYNFFPFYYEGPRNESEGGQGAGSDVDRELPRWQQRAGNSGVKIMLF